MALQVVTGGSRSLLQYWIQRSLQVPGLLTITPAAHQALWLQGQSPHPNLHVLSWSALLRRLGPAVLVPPPGWEPILTVDMPDSIVNALGLAGAPQFLRPATYAVVAALEAMADPDLARRLADRYPAWKELQAWVADAIPPDLVVGSRVYQYAGRQLADTATVIFYGFPRMPEAFYRMLAELAQGRSVELLVPQGSGPGFMPEVFRQGALPRELSPGGLGHRWSCLARGPAAVSAEVAAVMERMIADWGLKPDDLLVVEERSEDAVEVQRLGRRLGVPVTVSGPNTSPGGGFRRWLELWQAAEGAMPPSRLRQWLATLPGSRSGALPDWLEQGYQRLCSAQRWEEVALATRLLADHLQESRWQPLWERMEVWDRFTPPEVARRRGLFRDLMQWPFPDPEVLNPPEGVLAIGRESLGPIVRRAVVLVGPREDRPAEENPWLMGVGWSRGDGAAAWLQGAVAEADWVVAVGVGNNWGEVSWPAISGPDQWEAWPAPPGRYLPLPGRQLPTIRDWYRHRRAPARRGAWAGELQVEPLQRPLSPTALERYGRCPFAFFLRYHLNLGEVPAQDESAPAWLRGQWAHQVLAELSDAVLAQGDYARLREHILTAIEKAMADSPPPPDALSVMVEGEVESLASQVADALWWSRKELAGRQSVLREQTVRFAVGGLALEGRLDRVDRLADGSLEVIDFKTGAFSHPLKVGPDNLQMALYRLAIRDRGEPVAVRVMGLNARRRFATYAVGPEAEWPDPEPLVQTMGQWIAEGKFWPIPHGRPEPCRTCAYRIICPAEVGEEARDRAEHLPEVALWRQAEGGGEEE